MDYNVTFRKKNKGWQCIISYKDNFGKWKQKSKQGFKTQKEAKPWVNKTIKEMKKGVSNNIDPSMEGITFKEFSDMYIEHIKLYKEANTVLNYRTAINNFARLNNMPINKITKADIQSCVDVLINRGLKSNSTRIYTKRIKTVFNSAIEDYSLINKNPVDVELPKKAKTEKRALTKQEEIKLLKDFKKFQYILC